MKLVNKSRFDLIDVQFELVELQHRENPGRAIDHRTRLELRPNALSVLPGNRRGTKPNADFAFRVSTGEDLEAILRKNDRRVRLRVVGRHPISGVSKAASAEYRTLSDLVRGQFMHGDTMEIVPEPGGTSPLAV